MPEPESLVDAAAHAILAERFDVDTFSAGPGVRAVILRFEGRVAGTDTRSTATIAIPPESAAELMRAIVASYSAATAAGRDAFGNPT